MSPTGVFEKWVLERIAGLVFDALAKSAVFKGIETYKIKNQLGNTTKKALQPFLEYLEKEKQISEEAKQRLVEECLRQMRTYVEHPQKLLEGSLDGEKVLEQLHPKSGRPKNLPEVILQDGLVDEYLGLLPRIADLLCKLAADGENWALLSEKEILQRMDDLGEQQRQAAEIHLATLRGVENIDQTTQRIETKVDSLLDRQTPPTEPQTPTLLLTSLPRRAEHFTRREKELKQLLTLLHPGCLVTLVAAGGMGKTALASEALHILAGDEEKLRERFPDGVFYFPFYHLKEAALCLEQVCRVFGEQPLPNPQEAARRVLREKQALLVLDGTEEADDLPAVLSVCGRCGVLITTRDIKDAPGEDVIEVETLPPEDALQMLKALAGKYALDDDGNSDEAAKAIVRLTDRLTLAIFIAGKYLSRRHSAREYAEWLSVSRLDAVSHGEHTWENVEVMLKHSLEQVPEKSRTLLAISAALEYASFPADLIWAGAPELKSETQKRKALDPLLDYGLLQGGKGTYQVAHLLLYAYARKNLELPNERLLSMARYGVELAQREVPRGPVGFRTLDAYRPHLIWLETRLLGMQGKEEEQKLAFLLLSGSLAN